MVRPALPAPNAFSDARFGDLLTSGSAWLASDSAMATRQLVAQLLHLKPCIYRYTRAHTHFFTGCFYKALLPAS